MSQSLLLVGCKKRAPGYGVVVEIVRGLRGVVNDVGASGGMIATTSYFTRGAKELAANNPYRMALNDHQAVLRCIAD